MLKNIPKIISPELVKYLMEMGHGDELVIADANFPAHRIGQRVVRCDGHGVPVILDAILQLLPLDTYSDYQAGLMQVVPGDPTGRESLFSDSNGRKCSLRKYYPEKRCFVKK